MCMEIKNNTYRFTTLHPASTRDTDIIDRAEGTRADIDRGLIQGVIW